MSRIFQTMMNLFNDTRDVINRENTSWDSAATGILRSVQHDINSEMDFSRHPYSDISHKVVFLSGELEVKNFLLTQAMLVSEADIITDDISCTDWNEQDVFLNSCHWGRVVHAMRKELLSKSDNAAFHKRYLDEIRYRFGKINFNPDAYTGIKSLSQLYLDLRVQIVNSDMDGESYKRAKVEREQRIREMPFRVFCTYIENNGIKVGYSDCHFDTENDRKAFLEKYWWGIMVMAKHQFKWWCDRVRITDISKDFARAVLF